MIKHVKSLIALSALVFATSAQAAYTLVYLQNYTGYMHTLSVHNTKEQCEEAKVNFEKEFDREFDKKQMVYKCVDIANGAI
ncbi:hypothetical protein [Aggregatibacter actinomycetemcomitans]|uniref:hypothetical protein n=1 Tax=Aggregatibacter actinomycetemcomitans TaxID=714 RepID=UPI00197CA8D9|nr:hypothetical protein [Aggregatibacter actinomycetemcomitans]MBN6063277.1 hypothetical protein [Aggregatibacter actinomycetemcomitans]MBN6077802.1 hypothetical protein [Aggregatibacter actinomycetemcomitans]MBN6080964.1 hypothetical protein [Aggregatibacter actinomycetemcomitans]MBN6083146.1 hypothetical protein [Aggregatibacter actinomycetemcomitans]